MGGGGGGGGGVVGQLVPIITFSCICVRATSVWGRLLCPLFRFISVEVLYSIVRCVGGYK